VIDTGTSFDSDTLYGAEIAFQHNAFGATAEYAHVDAKPDTENGTTLQDRSFSGYYVDLFWSPTGESRNYVTSDGSFGRVTPRRTLGSEGGIGHVMLSLRYESLDLTDGGADQVPTDTTAFDGGDYSGIIGGVTWMPISYVKFQLNYGQYEGERAAANAGVGSSTAQDFAGQDWDADTITFRTQFDW
jgi:phosphate-selective porin OprO/OprP